eukprot:9474656-Pyramimonas_sp.AAC.1
MEEGGFKKPSAIDPPPKTEVGARSADRCALPIKFSLSMSTLSTIGRRAVAAEPDSDGEEQVNHFREIMYHIRLAAPVCLGMVCNRFIAAVSVAFVGRLGPQRLAAAALATTISNVSGNSVMVGLIFHGGGARPPTKPLHREYLFYLIPGLWGYAGKLAVQNYLHAQKHTTPTALAG